MADPKMGNRSTEQGEFEQGADFRGINLSTMPAAGAEVEVTPELDGGDLILRQVRPQTAVRRLELVHSDQDMMATQLLEDPALTSFSVPNVGKVETSPSRISTAITRNQNREQLIWFGVDSANMSAALGNRIIVRRDVTESEYICRSCRGKGHTEEVCRHCDGAQQREGINCNSCMVLGFESEKPHPSGFSRCTDCRGSGWKHGIVIPEAAQGVPCTGVVVSLGPATNLLKLGDRVMHSKYAGHTLQMKNETYTYMMETEVISLLKDLP